MKYERQTGQCYHTSFFLAPPGLPPEASLLSCFTLSINRSLAALSVAREPAISSVSRSLSASLRSCAGSFTVGESSGFHSLRSISSPTASLTISTRSEEHTSELQSRGHLV